MKPALTIIEASFANEFQVIALVDLTDKDQSGNGGLTVFTGSLAQCVDIVVKESHSAGYLEASKKAIQAICNTL